MSDHEEEYVNLVPFAGSRLKATAPFPEDDVDMETHEQDESAEIFLSDKTAEPTPAGERITTPYMTKYERARILGARALQISMNAPVMVELDGESDPYVIALKELRAKKIPFVIRRYLPDASYEDWRVTELIAD
ncbi:DNA-directed RNA polymerases I, II, and III subunit RPABC2 [Coemansia thaxteri]|uniref:DNA-directed RNA polymerases I, II, and III subunit RPABC2 n=1 Tax=Coemansia thaxteri TaxID=2663907 RepID=A0A9W8EDH6_9FUNG|nr:DNA-directed RNA polymerases I, II, and III subunit RPABC2 [Coemansia thaxteri]KAJ1999641.1 DNA-directed RNA polymerases I, II, and III subunit RPABC2 [Coemansia thaxteri]KAJ2464644.1 DNA-directed RNA polymerases I, II, and III subunit RPABC2 [Coemansia sp. RSA 2322]KAJ2475537.1 DNA-directed RNA polymerases I, II, and III subunit RPABC2 [Coemansia sp. RSA 2320]